MAENRDLVYLYDGTLEGLLCCVFESVRAREIPAAVYGPDNTQATFYPVRQIETDIEKAQRVLRSIPIKISPAARDLVLSGFLTCAPEKELLILKFLHLGYAHGARIVDRMQDETVCALVKAVRFLNNESHLFKEFLRFSQAGCGLAARITPKNFVLPALLGHFADRMPEENFLIYDNTHGMAALYHPYESRIVPIESFEMDAVDDQERQFRRLWKRFYQTIAIEGRYNPKCRMSHCPKRYWDNMTELSSLPEFAGLDGGDTPDEKNVKQLPAAMGR